MFFNRSLFDFKSVNETFFSAPGVTPEVQKAENIALSAFVDELS
jgi:hypothetical protein